MRWIQEDDVLAKLHARGEGLIYNDFAGTGAGGDKYNVLHAASCHWNGKSNTNVPKVFFEDLDEAVAWLEKNRGPEGKQWKRCGTCRAGGRRAPRGKGVQKPAPRLAPAQRGESNFVIRKGGSDAAPIVEVWSGRRLTFEPKGWLTSFRDELRRVLGQWKAHPDQLLHGVYGSGDADSFDVENVLFYNVGPQFVTEAGRYGVHFERSFVVPQPAADVGSRAMAHYHRYTLQEMDWRFTHWQSGELLARWEFDAASVTHLMDCARVWLALKRSAKVVTHREYAAGPLILRMVLGAPPGKGIAVITVLKSLIDGVVSACHYHDGDDVAELAQRLEWRTAADATDIAALLQERRHAVLGGRRLLWKRANGVQWNPADERCVAVEVQMQTLNRQQGVVVRGELREALPRRA